MSQELDALQSALLGPSFDVNSEEKIVVKAEDLQNEGINWADTFFEPQPGETYLIKLLPNPGGDLITHRSLYRSLPDPDRKGKTFRYISSGNAKTCPVLELFFELNAKKKEGDQVAEKKIEKYLSRTNQGCVKVQILQSKKAEDIGKIRLFTFSTFGPNAHISNLINQKLNPTKEQIEQGYEREDIFNIFDSPVMSVVCEKSTYDGREGRDFSKSGWAPKNKGAIAINEKGESRQFKKNDCVDRQLTDEAKPWFSAFLKQMQDPKTDVKVQFAYKNGDEAYLDEETREYVKSTRKKVEEIVPVIRDYSLADIAKYGKKEAESSEDKKDNGKKSKVKNVMEESLPEEMAGSVMAAAEKPVEKTKPTSEDDDEVASILNS